MIKKISCSILMGILFLSPGCSGKKEKPPAAVAEKTEVTPPEKVVEDLFEKLSSGEEEDYPEPFSAAVPPSVRGEFIAVFRAKREVIRYAVKKGEEKGNLAEVSVKYLYYPKEPDAPAERKLGEEKLTLVKDEGAWRIRKMGERFDRKTEEALFHHCLNSVMDATIAEETHRGAKGRYAGSVAALNEILPIPIDRCRELSIKDVTKSDYTVLASTLNYNPCFIVATTDGVVPMKYGECLEK